MILADKSFIASVIFSMINESLPLFLPFAFHRTYKVAKGKYSGDEQANVDIILNFPKF